MSGVEVAGLILAVLPLLLPLLDEYKNGMKRTAIFFKRKKHVEKLAKALLTQRVLLAENVRTLLARVGVDNVPEAPIELFHLLSNNDDVKQRVADYLGREACTSYLDAVSSSERVVRRLIRGIESLVPLLKLPQDDIITLLEASNATPTGQLVLKTRAKLTLSYYDLESSISDLDQSILLLERLHHAVSQRHEVTANSTDRKANRLAASLQTAREHTISLFDALVHSWNAGCHQEHEAKMYLNGTKIFGTQNDAKSTYFKKRKPHDFRLILGSKDGNAADVWHESTIEVLEDDGSSSNLPFPAATATAPSRPQVNIVAPVAMSPGGTMTLIDVPNLCTTIEWAVRERKLLRWYLASQQRIRCQYEDCASLLVSSDCHTVSLQDLLQPQPQTGSRVKIGLKNRMLLALNLASTLLQLQNTPWLKDSWSKNAIEFLKQPTPVQPATMSFPRVDTIDYQHPVISRQFSTAAQHAHRPQSLPPKEALLELGIMLLELWHETTLEAFHANTTLGQSGAPLPTNYWGRFMLASMWLDDPNDQPLPLYHTAISQCVKCFFGGTFSSPSWDDASFRKALCKDLVEPLFESCKQWM